MVRLPYALGALAAACAAACAAALGGCADAVDPTLGTDEAFSLYGYLDPTADRQAIRVVPIVGALDADTARALAVEVTSVERETGRAAAWRDSLVTYLDGSLGHVYVADYTPTPGATVALRVEETGGARRATTVEVAVPPLARPEVAAPRATPAEVTYPVRVAAPRVVTAELLYRVAGWPTAPDDTVLVADPVPPRLEALGDEAWGLDLPFVAMARAFLASPEARGTPLRLVDVTLRVFVGDAGWAVPPGGFDPDAVIEPGTFSNVADGFGFVGAGYHASVTWTPSPTTQKRAGFVVADDPAAALTLNEVSAEGWVELYNPTLEAVPIGGYAVVTETGEARVAAGRAVAAGGFAVVDVPLAPGPQRVELRAPSGALVLQLEVPNLYEADFGSYGSYPDGRSRSLGEFASFRDVDLFRGLNAPTRGAANALLGRFPVLNEVFTAGPDGWAEVYVPLPVETVRVTTDEALPFGAWPSAGGAGPFRAVAEAAGPLTLGQGGGEVLVAAWVNRSVPPRVVDVRTYGPQAPTEASGLLPDGDAASWRPGLRPTRGTANAAARLAL